MASQMTAFARQVGIVSGHSVKPNTKKSKPVALSVFLDETQEEYSKIVAFLIDVVQNEWGEIGKYSKLEEQKTCLEKLTHATKAHPNPKYEIDDIHPQVPRYIMRSAFAHALSAYKSWKSNHENWESAPQEERGKEPTLQLNRKLCPTCYRKQTYNKGKGKWVELKLYNGRTWQWCTVPLKGSQFKQITKYMQVSGHDISCPTIIKRGRKWLLSYLVKIPSVQYKDESIDNARICGVDLGVNTAATLVVMDTDGTVIASKFVKLAREEDRLRHALGRLRKRQSNGSKKNRKFWNYIKNLNHQLSVETSKAIIAFAEEHDCSTIVCEFLQFTGKVSGSRNHRLSVWRKREVYDLLVNAAHKRGMHVHQVCAWGTSKLAFDGSGECLRGRDIVDENGNSRGFGYCLVEFSNGKLYNADLNAAKNIAARGIISIYQKAISAKRWSKLVAKVPELSRRTSCTLSTLIDLRAALPSVS